MFMCVCVWGRGGVIFHIYVRALLYKLPFFYVLQSVQKNDI